MGKKRDKDNPRTGTGKKAHTGLGGAQAETRSERPGGPEDSGWKNYLTAPVDIASTVVFRLAFGGILLVEMFRFFAFGYIKSLYIDPAFYFPFYGFDWVRPWPAPIMYVHFVVLAVAAICIASGFFYRVATWVFFVGFTHVFLIDQTRYLNHFYLICLLAFLLAWIPAHRAFSLDAMRNPKLRSDVIPRWSLLLLRFQMAVVYVGGGVAKINHDWLRGEPMRLWLSREVDTPLIGPLLGHALSPYFFAYGGLVYDLVVPFLLLWRKTRVPAFLVTLFFHLTNSQLFDIGIFPWFMIPASTIFFPPDWPRRWLRRYGRTSALPGLPSWKAAIFGLYVAAQILVPFRHFLYPGRAAWTEEGAKFAWRMKLNEKGADIGFHILDANGQPLQGELPRFSLTPTQMRLMAATPEMIVLGANHIADVLHEHGFEDVQVRVRSQVTLNGRAPQDLVDPEVDLGSVRRSLRPAPWIVPLTTELGTGSPAETMSGPR